MQKFGHDPSQKNTNVLSEREVKEKLATAAKEQQDQPEDDDKKEEEEN